MVCVTLEGLWKIAHRIVDFRFFVKFNRSGPAINFIFWTIKEHVGYASKKLPIKEKSSSTWWVLLWKYYGWFLRELSIFDFLSSFTGPDLQKFSIFELPRCILVMHQKSSFNQAKDVINMECVTLEGLWMISDRLVNFRFFVKFHSCNNFQFLNYHRACSLCIKKRSWSSKRPHQHGECYSGRIMDDFW